MLLSEGKGKPITKNIHIMGQTQRSNDKLSHY